MERELIEEVGQEISKETIRFIKSIERLAYPEEMQLMQEDENVYDISDTYDTPVSRITIARNKDWYIIYGEDYKHIELIDVASSPSRDKEKSRKEIHDYLVNVINKKAYDSGKSVILSAKEDTSYKMIQRMVNNHEYEIIEDIMDTWDYDSAIIMHNLVLRPINVNKHDNK